MTKPYEPFTLAHVRGRRSLTAGLVSAAVLLSLPACSLNKMVADQTGSLMSESAPALEGFWDYGLAGQGIPGAILQLEAFYSVSPDNKDLAINLAKAYAAYALGWVENEYEIAEAEGDITKADRLRQRARLMYLRGRDLALHALQVHEAGARDIHGQDLDEALKSRAPDALPLHLKKRYRRQEAVPMLFWTGMCWGAAINMALDQPDLIVDVPVARAFVERAMELDDMYYTGSAYLFMGALEAAVPVAMGGNPEKGREYFETGLAKTDRKNHMMLIKYARLYAVATQNRELYTRLLQEIIDAPDLGAAVRLNNKVARIRAERYLAEADSLF